MKLLRAQPLPPFVGAQLDPARRRRVAVAYQAQDAGPGEQAGGGSDRRRLATQVVDQALGIDRKVVEEDDALRVDQDEPGRARAAVALHQRR